MRTTRLLVFCALAAGLSAQHTTTIVTAAPTTPLAGTVAKVPQLKYTEFVLANGMHVILSEDHSLPVVTESIIVNVGGRAEHKGRSGFAHLFEHLMFEGSKDAPKGVFDQLVEGYGGNDNASTHTDYTFYYENVPSNVLPTVMWLDADRLAALNVTQENMKNQISVVEEEKRMRVDNAPYGPLLYVNMAQNGFANWQNSHPVIGSFADLDAATLADVQQFFQDYYAPHNCTLTIVGDFDTAKTQELVNQYFSWIPNRGTITPVDTAEPATPPAKTITVKDTQAKLPALTMAWQGPKRDSPDFYALTLVGNYLFNGESSLLYQSLVKKSQVAIEVDGGLGFPNADYTDYKAPGLFSALVIHKPDTTPDQVQGLVYQQIHQIEATGVPPSDLARLKTKFQSDWIESEQTTEDRAQLLALAALLQGSPEDANTELRNYLAVTSEDMQRACRDYLTQARASVVIDQPAPAAGNGGGQ